MVLFLIQLKDVPITSLDNTMSWIVSPEQILCDVGVAIAFGLGVTVRVTLKDVPGQPFAIGVIIEFTVWDMKVLFIGIPILSPEPFSAILVTLVKLSLVHE